MTSFKIFASRFAALFRKRHFEQEMDDEMRSHLEMLIDENVRCGMSPEEARYAALRSFGGVDQTKEIYRDQRGLPMMETLAQDLRYGLRQLSRSPGYTVVTILTLALGIGANTAIFSVVNAVMMRPLPYQRSDRLVWIAQVIPALKAELAGGGDYVDWRDQNQALEQLTAFDESGSFNLTGHGTPQRVHAARVSASFFATLGAEPRLGRAFTAEEDQPNGRNAAILMHAFWAQHFGSDPQVLGQTVTLNATPYTVVGVMPASFRFPGGAEIQMLVPLALNAASERLRVQNTLVHIIGLLKPGVSLVRARADLDAISKRAQSQSMPGPAGPGAGNAGPGSAPTPGQGSMIRMTITGGPPPPNGPAAQLRLPAGAPLGDRGREVVNLALAPSTVPHARPSGTPPERRDGLSVERHLVLGGAPPTPGPTAGPRTMVRRFIPSDVELKVVPLREKLAGNLRPAMLILLGVVGVVLLIACANVANLTLTRATVRTREMAVRAALGAGRRRLLRQLLSESMLLGIFGGAVGLLLAAWGVKLMLRLIPASVGGDILSVVSVGVDANVLLFALGTSLLTGLLFGLAPAIVVTRTDLVETLKEGGQVSRAGLGGRVLRGSLVVAEISLTLVLLAGAGLLIKSFYRLLSVDPGFAPERVLTVNLSLADSQYPSPVKQHAFFSEVLRRVESLPGVRSAALGDSLPLSPYRARMMIRLAADSPTSSLPSSITTILLSRMTVSPGYFYTLGIPLLKGRTFTDSDNEQSPKVAVINETFARHQWPGQDPIGKQLPLMESGVTVVGVVGNVRHEGLSEDMESELYVPFLQYPVSFMQLGVRSVADPVGLASAVRAQIAAVDPELPIFNVSTLEQTLAESVAPRRFNFLLLGVFAVIALVLATVGTYGVMACSVTQRTREIGIRMALGAERRHVLRLVLAQGLGLALAGIAIGMVGALVLARFISSLLFEVRPTDPLTLVAVAVFLAGVSLAACYVPARRATKVDPLVALRYE